MKGYISNSLIAAVALACSTSADLVSYAPLDPSPGPAFKVGIPSGSSISDTTAAPIYFQLTAPDTYRWVGLGIGTGMAGASIFVMYADGTGNVTISPRDGVGHVQPQLDSQLASGVTLLAGSGVSGGVMTANVRCTTCTLDSSDKSSSPWITAWGTGSALDSTSQSATIQQHGDDAYRTFSFDLSQASISSDANPFVAAAAASSASGASATGTAGASSTGGSSPSTPTSGNSGVVSSGGGPAAENEIVTYQKAHGIIMGITFVLLFPLGAVFMRLAGSPLIHGALQIFAMLLMTAGFGLGVHLAKIQSYLFENAGRTHTIFGTVVFAIFFIQPFLGLAHHTFYKKNQARNAVSHSHIWFGRIIMILAVINGGLGLQLAANTKGGEIAYGVVAGVVAVVYAVVVIFKRKNTETKWGGREKVDSRNGSE